MKITRVEALHYRLPVVKEVADGTQDCLLVRVQTDAGISGLGEVVSGSYVARAVVEAPQSAPFRHGLAHIVEEWIPSIRKPCFRRCSRARTGTDRAAFLATL